jgi:hypothetical protein
MVVVSLLKGELQSLKGELQSLQTQQMPCNAQLQSLQQQLNTCNSQLAACNSQTTPSPQPDTVCNLFDWIKLAFIHHIFMSVYQLYNAKTGPARHEKSQPGSKTHAVMFNNNLPHAINNYQHATARQLQARN